MPDTDFMSLAWPYFLLTENPYFLIQTSIESWKYLVEKEGWGYRVLSPDLEAYNFQDGSRWIEQ